MTGGSPAIYYTVKWDAPRCWVNFNHFGLSEKFSDFRSYPTSQVTHDDHINGYGCYYNYDHLTND